jgi:hypothetical protein
MLKPEQVPKEAADALQKLISRGVFTSTEEAIAAAINAWPEMYRVSYGGDEPPLLVLPLPQEPRDE